VLSHLLPSIFASIPTILCTLRYPPLTGLCEVQIAVTEDYYRNMQTV